MSIAAPTHDLNREARPCNTVGSPAEFWCSAAENSLARADGTCISPYEARLCDSCADVLAMQSCFTNSAASRDPHTFESPHFRPNANATVAPRVVTTSDRNGPRYALHLRPEPAPLCGCVALPARLCRSLHQGRPYARSTALVAALGHAAAACAQSLSIHDVSCVVSHGFPDLADW